MAKLSRTQIQEIQDLINSMIEKMGSQEQPNPSFDQSMRLVTVTRQLVMNAPHQYGVQTLQPNARPIPGMPGFTHHTESHVPPPVYHRPVAAFAILVPATDEGIRYGKRMAEQYIHNFQNKYVEFRHSSFYIDVTEVNTSAITDGVPSTLDWQREAGKFHPDNPHTTGQLDISNSAFLHILHGGSHASPFNRPQPIFEDRRANPFERQPVPSTTPPASVTPSDTVPSTPAAPDRPHGSKRRKSSTQSQE